MKTFKKSKKSHLVSFSAVAMLLIISIVYIIISFIEHGSVLNSVMAFAIGFAAIIGIQFLKEEWLFKAAPILYVIIIAVLCLQLIVGHDGNPPYSLRRFNLFGTITLFTSSLMPLAYLQYGRIIGQYKKMNVGTLLFLVGIMAIPIALVFFQNNIKPVMLSLIVCFVTFIQIKKSKKANIPLFAFLVPIVAMMALCFYLYQLNGYVAEKFQTILLRGTNDPMNLGWVRTYLDDLFQKSVLFGACDNAANLPSVIKSLSIFGNHNAVMILAKYGWVAFVSLLIVFIVFSTCLFKMISKIQQSSFAKFTAFMLSVSLTAQAVYSLVGLFLLTGSGVDMPFFSISTSNILNYISFGIILLLYKSRNKEPELTEKEVKEPEFLNSLSNKLKEFAINKD